MEHAVDDLAQRIRRARGVRLRPRGQRSRGLVEAGPAVEELSTLALQAPPRHEPSELVVTAAAGMPLVELEALLAEAGQCLAFEPPRLGSGGTVGGMVASGLAGPARMRSGPLRDAVLGVDLLNGRGERLSFGGQVMKNVAGYDLSRLLAGSWGALGVITSVSLKVGAIAPRQATLVFEMTQREALERLARWRCEPLPLEASTWGDEDGTPRLHLRLAGGESSVEAACRRLGGERQDDEAARARWRAIRDRRHGCLARTERLWRVSLPPTTPPLALDAPTFVEWHGGLRWLDAAPDQGERLQGLARDAGGRAQPPGRPAGLADSGAARVQAALLEAFDPDGVFDRDPLAVAS